MVSESIILRRQAWLVVLLFFVSIEAQAAFGGLVPLTHSGQLSYVYGYADSAGTQSESTSLLVGMSSSGYIWRPWFATTSLALNVGLSSSQSTSGSSKGTTGTGNFGLGVFSRSRFPFTLNYSRSDSRTQRAFDLAQVSGETSFRVTRLILRQTYRPRGNKQLYKGWYSTSQFSGGSFGSESTAYGLDYKLRVSKQSFAVTASRSAVGVKGVGSESTTDAISVSHVYTPSAEVGVTSLVTYVEASPSSKLVTTINSQAFSSFFWRPEYRAVSVSGGVRLAEVKSEGTTNTVARSLNTNFGLGYRVTRALNLNASLTVGTSDNGAGQTLSTVQTLNISYAGQQRQWEGFSYGWQWGANGSNSTSRTEAEGVTTTSDRQGISTSLGHNLTKSWPLGRVSSVSAGFSQAGSGSKGSETKTVNSTISHGVNTSWSTRGNHGSTYMSARLSDSRSFGSKDAVFNSFSVNYTSDFIFNRLSSINGNVNYQASQNTAKDDLLGKVENSTRTLNGGMSYRHSRPFGVYNLTFTSFLQGSKQINSPIPSATLRVSGTFRYSLGRLGTSLGFRASESASGNIAKSMNFQATRSF